MHFGSPGCQCSKRMLERAPEQDKAIWAQSEKLRIESEVEKTYKTMVLNIAGIPSFLRKNNRGVLKLVKWKPEDDEPCQPRGSKRPRTKQMERQHGRTPRGRLLPWKGD